MDAGDQALHRRASASGNGRATTSGGEPDVVMACCGDVPTLETLAAVDSCAQHVPELKIRVVNVVDLMTLQPRERASARAVRPRLRRALHHRQADHLRLSRLSVADPSPDLPAHQPRQPARPRLQGRRHDDHAVRHVRAERPRPLPSGRRRDRPRAEARRARGLRQAGPPRQAHRPPRNTFSATAKTCPRSRTGPGGGGAEFSGQGTTSTEGDNV